MLPDVAIFSILSSKTCLVSLMAIYIRGVGCFFKRRGLDAEQCFRVKPLLCELGCVSCVSPAV